MAALTLSLTSQVGILITEGTICSVGKTMKKLLILALIFLGVISGFGQSLTFPSHTTIDWDPGLSYGRGGIPNRPTGSGTTINAHTTYGADNTGVTDATNAIQNALNAATAGSVVYLPTGTYLVGGTLHLVSNVSLRGDGPDLTIIHYTGSYGCLSADNGVGWAPSQAITASASKGASTITVYSSASMAVGGFVNISYTDPSFVDIYGVEGYNGCAGAPDTGGGSAYTCDQNDDTRCLMQIAKITAINGDVLTLEHGLYRGTGTNPYVNYQASAFTTGVGVENLRIHSTGTGVDQPTILLSNCVLSWIKNIKSFLDSGTENYCHVFMYNSYANEVRDSWFQGGGQNSSGLDYGVYLFSNTSECLVENNVFVGMRHSMITAGASGCVFGYNDSVGNWESDSGNTWCAEDGCSHGAESFYNLWEGNICCQLNLDNIHGGNAWNLFYRNWSLAWSTALSTTSAVNYRYAVVLMFNTQAAKVAGNVYGQSGDITTGGPGIHNRGVTSDYIVDDTNDESVPNTGESNATYYLQGNYSYLTNSTTWVGGTAVTLPASMYQSNKPSWWGSTAYPAIGPDLTPVNGSTPAQVRYNNGD
jgi:hypothetical protein